MPSVLVTGAAGYIGSGFVHNLAAAGWDVRALTRQQADYLGMDQVVADLAKDARAAAAACDGVDVVVHLAGDNEVVAARDPAFALGGTVLATERLVEAVATSEVKRFVYLSTIHAYGERMAPGATLTEDLRPEPRAPYAVARLASEHRVAALSPSGVEVVVLRLTNSMGAPFHPDVDRWTLLSNDLSRQGVLTGRLELRSSGKQWRDFIAVTDVRAIMETACQFEPAELPPGLYNLGSGAPMTILAMAGLVQDAFERCTGDRPELRVPETGGDAAAPYHVSIERLAAHGLRAVTPVADAVEDTVRFCIEHKEALAG